MSSRKTSVVLSPNALNDIDDILLFTRQRWGTGQRKQYKRRLGEVLDALARNPHIGLERSEISPGVRSFPVERHLILYRFGGGTINVLRVIHQNRDLDQIFRQTETLD
jgi:toxin ParE1/3/4